ncbi:sensor histidine kinase [Streptomyces sp. NBC_01304]|uniref:sensor histidine kinase n=1 Tax=Streptomyces sp. NBC_01304 TaxID=2903818 RepID=UPI002E1117D9|nr:ATP-binding protein [Streptomyces sp. NBC_01304]
MPSRLQRLPTRARTALTAGCAALLLAGGGAWFLRHSLYEHQLAAARETSLVQARLIALDLRKDGHPSGAPGEPTDTSWMHWLLTPDGADANWMAAAFPGVARALPRAPAGTPAGWSESTTVHLPAVRPGCGFGEQPAPEQQAKAAHCESLAAPLAGQTLTLVATTAVPAGKTEADRYTVYVPVLPFTARRSTDALDPYLLAGVPLSAAVVALVAWFATGRALRPVEAIRTRFAAITAQHLERRVPVPPAEDEISRMAVTINHTLDSLERADVQQRRFVADAAHELRSPLAGLRAGLEVSLAHPEHTDWPQATQEALDSVARLQLLADDLLFLARPDSQGADPIDLRVDLSDLAGDLCTEARHAHPDGPGVTLQATDPAYVRGHAGQLRRLLRNLLDNAVRHARSRVTLTVFAEEGRAHCLVANDGSPIPAADRERIFERFTRLDEARSRDEGGSGLGLAIARAIAQRHGGTLTVSDPPPGQGAAFLVCLPSSPPPEAEPDDSDPPAPAA